jgi:anaerobic magnesium-protoporphyrin IX monomethyl ester cyclase
MEISVERAVAGADLTCQLDALFINAPLRDYGLRPRVNDFTLPVLGMGYIATYAARQGFNVGVVDAEALGLGIRIMVGGHQAKAMPTETLTDPRFARIEALVLGEGETRGRRVAEGQAHAVAEEAAEVVAVVLMDAIVGRLSGNSG